MTTKARRYFSGNTLDNALLQAARHHGLPPEEIAYRKIDKRHGFLKARKGVVIEVDPESPRREARAANSDRGVSAAEQRHREAEAEEVVELEWEADETGEMRDMEEAEPEDRSEETDEVDRLEGEEDGSESGAMEDLVEAAERGLQEILAFARLDLEYEVSQGDGQLDIELRGPDRDRLLEDRGNLILSIQHVLPRLIRGYSGRSIPCHVDSENFHETRRVELKEMAEEVAAEVRQSQRPRTLPPMNPAERRIIHVALADDKEVKTESQGRGFFKRVTISPAMRRPRGFDRYSR